MKVVLLKDIAKIGNKYEIKEVKDGYAQNFLIPNGLVKPATEQAVAWAEMQKEIQSKKIEQDLVKSQEIASKIDGQEIEIYVKAGDKGQLFEKITPQKIAEKIKELGFDVKGSQVETKESIQQLGEFNVKVQLGHNLEAEIKLIVGEEK